MTQSFRRVFIFIFLSVVSLTSQIEASRPPSSIIPPSFEEGFFWPNDVTLKPKMGLKNAYDATTAFPVLFSNCSASYISPDGYLLTAFHCVISALNLDSSYQQELADGAEVYIVPQEAVIGKKYTSFFGFSATVVEAGDGFGQFDERKVHTYDPSVIKNIQDVIGTDWAILKVDGISKNACLRAAGQTPAEEEYSWAIGYPGSTKRGTGETTDNFKKLVSYGKIAYSAENSGYYKTLDKPNRGISLDFWKTLVDRGEYIITDSDVQGGNSGSPVINDESQLIGLLVQGLVPDQSISYENYNTYTAGVIQLDFIRRSLGEKKFQKYFTCKE